jgi:hypothetical protein
VASLSNHVSITISQDSVGIARAGFGVPMILSATANWVERIRFYSGLSEVAQDFASTSSAEYLAAQAIFSQSPRPERIAIGRSALPPTQQYTLAATARDSYTYTVGVEGDGVTSTEVSYTSDSSATLTEIHTGLVAALNAVAGNNYLAVLDGTPSNPFTVTADAAGEWFSISVKPTDIAIAQTHADPGVATDLAAIATEDSSWYALCTLYNSDAYVKAAAAWVEANKKIYIFDINESEAVTDASDGTQGTLDDLKTLGYARTMGAYYPEPAAMMAAAWMGRVLPLEPGSETWKFKSLAGVGATNLTSTQRTNVVNRNANSIETVAGVKVTFNGTTSDGDFLDVQRGLDWLEDDMSVRVMGMLAGLDKVPYTDAGVALIQAQVIASLQSAVAKGILTSDPAPVVTVPKVANVSPSDKAARILPDVKFSATLAGAIHKVNITGVVSV